MKAASIEARLELVRAGFFAWDAEVNDFRKRHLAEALWWLCDDLDQDIEVGGHVAANYDRSYLASLTEMAEEIFKSGARPAEFHRVDEFCLKAGLHKPAGDDPRPPTA